MLLEPQVYPPPCPPGTQWHRTMLLCSLAVLLWLSPPFLHSGARKHGLAIHGFGARSPNPWIGKRRPP
eukprot:784288-Pyramimonas_sp.AAC.1